jgi:phenylacetate-CoA ligase
MLFPTKEWSVSVLYEKILLPASDMLTGRTRYKSFRFLMESQSWSRERLDEYQNEKLRQLIKHAYDNVPYYTELMKKQGIIPDDIKTKEDLIEFPVSTKDDLRKATGKLLALNIKASTYSISFSSGSTGEPFKFYMSKSAESLSKASAIRAWYWNGYRLGDKYVKISMNPRKSKEKILQDFVNRSKYLSSTSLNEDQFSMMINEMIRFQPKYIRGYPVPLLYLSSLMNNQEDALAGCLQGINTTGSVLHADVREKIEDVFHAKIFDSYSCEGGSNFTQCPNCGYYHPSEEYAISEFISDSYTEKDSRRPHRHITTDLHNYAQPFIRYDTQDYIIEEKDNTLSCGLSYRKIKGIVGRDSDIIITPSGQILLAENFAAYFEYILEIEAYQVIQSRLNKIDINIIKSAGFSNQVYERTYAYWRDYIDKEVEVSLNVVNNIELTPTGKRRTVIRDSSIPLDIF